MRIIINADDLGASLRANEIIFDLMADKKITSAIIRDNGTFVSDVIEGSTLFS